MKIDIHCHTTNRALTGMSQDTADIETIVHEMDACGVDTVVLLASYSPHKGTGISNYRLLHWIEKSGHADRFKMFGSLDMEHYFFQGMNELEELAQNRLLGGIKLYGGYQSIDWEGRHDCKVAKVFGLAERYELPVMVHGGNCHSRNVREDCDGLNPSQLLRVVSSFVCVPTIVSHLAYPYVLELLSAMNKHPHLYTDVSGILDASVCPEDVIMVRMALDKVGPSRILFGTDFPLQSFANTIDLVELSMQEYSFQDKEMVYSGNAARILSKIPKVRL
jgi:uncharacterized protein